MPSAHEAFGGVAAKYEALCGIAAKHEAKPWQASLTIFFAFFAKKGKKWSGWRGLSETVSQPKKSADYRKLPSARLNTETISK